jgi:hypothetical protein
MTTKTCEYLTRWRYVSGYVRCGKPAVLRYEAAGGGHMYLCDEHGAAHATYAERLVDGQWVSPSPTAARGPAAD